MDTSQTFSDNFEVTLTVYKETFEINEPVLAIIRVKNSNDVTAKFCIYHTPFEGIANNIFEIERDGEALGYHGMMKKRAAPGDSDYIELKPGESTTCTVELNEVYSLDKKGTYTIRFIGNTSINGLPDSTKITFTMN